MWRVKSKRLELVSIRSKSETASLAARSTGVDMPKKLACLSMKHSPYQRTFHLLKGAAIPVPFYTAYVALHHKAQIQQGETVLISAGGGGVGVAAIQLAKAAGARVITTVGSQEKADKTRALGADEALNYKEQDFAVEVQNLTAGKGVAVIIENVAADNFAKDFSAISRYGRIVIIGTGTGKAPEATFMTGAALFKEVSIYGMALPNSVALIPDIANALIPLFTDQNIRAVVHKSYPLADSICKRYGI